MDWVITHGPTIGITFAKKCVDLLDLGIGFCQKLTVHLSAANQRQEPVQERGCIDLDPYQQRESRTNLQRELLAPPTYSTYLGAFPKVHVPRFWGKYAKS